MNVPGPGTEPQYTDLSCGLSPMGRVPFPIPLPQGLRSVFSAAVGPGPPSHSPGSVSPRMLGLTVSRQVMGLGAESPSSTFSGSAPLVFKRGPWHHRPSLQSPLLGSPSAQKAASPSVSPSLPPSVRTTLRAGEHTSRHFLRSICGHYALSRDIIVARLHPPPRFSLPLGP